MYKNIFCSVKALKDKTVIKIAANVNGKHFMALTSDKEVYSWGNGDCGRLGNYCPKIISNN